jgi:hypothetical protein
MKTQTDWLDILHSLVMLREKTFFREAIPVPEKVIWGQLALFNLPMKTWIKRECVSLYIVAVLLVLF